MKITTALCPLFAAAVFLCSSLALSAAEPPSNHLALVTKLTTAVANADYESFISEGDSAFRRISKEQFSVVAAKLGHRLKAGYELSFLGELNQGGYLVSLWRLRFKDNGDDALATLSVKDGKVGGFFIR